MLKDTDETNDADDSERNQGKLLGELVHAELQRSPLLFDLVKGIMSEYQGKKECDTDVLHHGKDDAKFGVSSSSDNHALASAWKRSLVQLE